MQNRYVGDVGDFAKFGLLRFLSGVTDPEPGELLPVGLIWYMHQDERHNADKTKINNDGRHTGYLDMHRKNRELYGDRDPELWSKLGHLVGQDRRCVHCVADARLLPEGTSYYEPLLTYIPRMPREQKAAVRECWLRNALMETRGADIVCVDPDNGLAPDARAMLDPGKGTKHVYMADLAALWDRGQSLVVYHHSNRDGKVPVQIERVAEKLGDSLPNAAPISLWFHGGTARAFFVVPQPGEKGDLIRDRVARFMDSGWAHPRLFEEVPRV